MQERVAGQANGGDGAIHRCGDSRRAEEVLAMVDHPGANAAPHGMTMMEADGSADEMMADTEPETSDRASGMFVRSKSGLLVHAADALEARRPSRWWGACWTIQWRMTDDIAVPGQTHTTCPMTRSVMLSGPTALKSRLTCLVLQMEQTRLNIVHQMYLLLLHGQLTLVPLLSEPQRILDIGTGTGEWAIAMAETYPNADVTGTDLSAIQPDAVPSNVFFEVDDAEEEWTFGQQFDLIHLRNLAGSFKHWDEIYEECFRHLKPGGYIEVIEFDHSQTAKPVPDSYIAIFLSAIREAAERSGRHWTATHLRRGVIEAAGFEEVKRTTMTIPIGTKGADMSQRTIGKLWLICVLEGLEAASLRILTRELGWEADDVRDVCQKVRKELTEGKHQLTTTVYVFICSHSPVVQSASELIFDLDNSSLPGNH